MESKCKNARCCRGIKHSAEDVKGNVFQCRNCSVVITKENLGDQGGCRMCGPCSDQMQRCGHCGRPF
jgi:hypothetical protein